MPFRQYGGYAYPTFDGFEFMNYDEMAPYEAFSLVTPPDVACQSST